MTNLANVKNAGWEVAGGRKLRSSDVDAGKKANGVPTKQSKEAQLLKMPKVDTLPPLKADATIYDLIRDSDEDEDMKKSESKTRVTRSSLTAAGENTKTNGTSKPAASPKSNKSKQQQESLNLLSNSMNSATNAKQKKQATTPQPKNVEHEIRNSVENLNYDDLEREYKSLNILFKDNSNLIAQNFASYFNQLLNNVPEDDYYLKQQNETVNPSNFLEKRVSKLLNNIFTKLSKSDSEKVFEYCFETIFSDKTLSTHGFKVIIQLLVKHSPNLLVNNLEKLNEIMKINKHRHQKCLVALWALGQTGFYNLSNGINVWFESMLPMINVKNCTNYVVGYLPKLFDLHKLDERTTTTSSESNLMLSLDQYNTFYELVNDKTQLNLSKEFAQKFRSAFFSLRSLFIRDCLNSAANIEQLLRILPLNDQNNDKQKDLLEIMSEMVFKNRDTLTIWKQIYNKYLQQSIILLEHLSDNYNRRLRSLKKMRELLYHFNEQSENLLKKQAKSTTQKEAKYKKTGKQSANDAELNRKLNALSAKLIQSHFRRTSKLAMGLRTLFYLSLFVAAFFYWDINSNKSIYTNSLQKELAKYGLLDHALKLVSTVKQLALNIQNKFNYYAPIYYKQFNQNVLPVLKTYWNMSVEYFNLFLAKVQPYVNTALVYVQQGIDFINQNYPMLVKNLISVMELAINYAITMYNLMSVYLAYGVDFIGINLFGYKNGELNRILLDAFKISLDYVIKFFQSLEKYFA